MGCILSIMNMVSKCSVKKTKNEYFREIFDGLDTDGTQSLNASELSIIWKLVQDKKLLELKRELDTYTTKKTLEMNIIKMQDSSKLLDDVEKFDIKAFINTMKKLKLNDNQIHELWVSTKQNEILTIKNELNRDFD